MPSPRKTRDLASPPGKAKHSSPKILTTELRVKETHRLIASKYSETGTVLSRLSANISTLTHLLELDDATNDRFLGEEGLLPGIGIHELVYGIRYAHIVNAAFTHASPTGGRFNSPTRGAWYASFDRATSVAEIAFHKLLALEEIDWPHEEISTSDDYLADLTSRFHDLRKPELANLHPVMPAAPEDPLPASLISAKASGMTPEFEPFARYLRPDPIPRCYARPQRLTERLLTRKSNGIIYPSVRRPGGTCVAVFRPALVYNVRRGARLELRLQRDRPFRVSQANEVPIPKS